MCVRECASVCVRESQDKKSTTSQYLRINHIPPNPYLHTCGLPRSLSSLSGKKTDSDSRAQIKKSAVAKLFDKMHVSMDVEIRQRLHDEPLIRFIILLSRSFCLAYFLSCSLSLCLLLACFLSQKHARTSCGSSIW